MTTNVCELFVYVGKFYLIEVYTHVLLSKPLFCMCFFVCCHINPLRPGGAIWWPLLGLLSWCPISKPSPSNSFINQAPVKGARYSDELGILNCITRFQDCWPSNGGQATCPISSTHISSLSCRIPLVYYLFHKMPNLYESISCFPPCSELKTYDHEIVVECR